MKFLIRFATTGDKIISEAFNELGIITLSTDVDLFLYSESLDNELHYDVRKIYDIFKLPILGKGYVDDIFLYSKTNCSVVALNKIVDYNNFRYKNLFEEYKKAPENLGGNNIFVIQDSKVQYVDYNIALFREIKASGQHKGIAMIEINSKELTKEFGNIKNKTLYIMKDRVVLYSNNEEMNGKELNLAQGYYLNNSSVMKSNTTNLTYIVLSSDKLEYSDELKIFRKLLTTIIVFVIVLCVILCFIASVKIFSPMKSILDAFEKNSQFIFLESKTESEKNEVKYILRAIERSVENHEHYEEELDKRVFLLKKAQAIALQAQINPHFFHNTLETIDCIALRKLGIGNGISSVTNALSSMLRYSLENTDTIITIEEEIKHASMYLEIQKIRYSDKFDVEWQVEEDVLLCKTVKIIMQPIIENSIYHGIKPMREKGLIRISIKEGAECISIIIMDNGLGMTLNQLEHLRSELVKEEIKENLHLGLSNVNQRIKLYFGEEYGVTIESDINTGTTVTIRVPKIYNSAQK